MRVAIKMRNQNEEIFIFSQKMLKTKNWEQSNLLNKTNDIGVMLLLIIISANHENKAINLKTLCQSVKFSQRSVSYSIKNLISLGWVELVADPKDKRRQLIKTTHLFMSLFLQYIDQLD